MNGIAKRGACRKSLLIALFREKVQRKEASQQHECKRNGNAMLAAAVQERKFMEMGSQSGGFFLIKKRGNVQKNTN